MHKGRLEAFSDGVLAVIITIMVLELHVPEGADLAALATSVPTLIFYVLSFIYIGIYWNNHHHLMQATHSVTGPILWANLHLLFWLSLVPFATAWMGEHHKESLPVAAYGAVLILAAVAYTILSRLIIAHEGPASTLAQAVGADVKGWFSLVLYATGFGLAFVTPMAAKLIYAAVAAIWFIPDRRIEKVVTSEKT
ncbi:MAG: TMEM175 family protein [Caulobacteraceae bacterium]